jgi:hypothetical protein
MPTPGQELASIDFASMLGGPLIACVNAQAQAAMSAVNFIKEVGFRKAAGEQDAEDAQTETPIYVTFKYPKEVSPYQPAIAGVTGVTEVGNPNYPLGLKPHTGADPNAPANTDAFPNGLPKYVAPVATVTPKDAVAATFETMLIEFPILTMLPIPYLRIEEVIIDFNAKIDSIEYQKIDTSLKVDAALEVRQRWTGGSAKLNVSASYQRNTQQGTSVQRTYSMAVHIKAVQDEMPGGMQKLLDILESNIRSQPAA